MQTELEVLLTLPNHYERHLGPISQGWIDKTHGESNALQIVKFANTPRGGVHTYATLGLSNFVLKLSETKKLRQELIGSADAGTDGAQFASLLLSAAEGMIASEKAVLRGQAINQVFPPSASSMFSALYYTNPSPFDEGLTHFGPTLLIPLVFAYAIPISAAERDYLKTNGWTSFERLLEEQDPDIWNLQNREELALEG